MVSNKQRSTLLNINRALIYSFALLGIFFDSSLAYILSLTLWVWLFPCLRYETKLIKYFQRHL